MEKETILYYPQAFLSELKRYIDDRTHGPIFITTTGNAVLRHWVYMSFAAAGVQSGIGKVTPHQLRASAITWLRGKGHAAEDIQRISGHSSVEMVLFYDKTPMENNLTKEVVLI